MPPAAQQAAPEGAVGRPLRAVRYRCELSAGPLDRSALITLGRHYALTPRLAVRWMSAQAERVARALDPDPEARWAGVTVLRPVEDGRPDPGGTMRRWARDMDERENALAVLRQGWPYIATAQDETTHYCLLAEPIPPPFSSGLRLYRRAHSCL